MLSNVSALYDDRQLVFLGTSQRAQTSQAFWLEGWSWTKTRKKNNPQASVSVQSVYAIGICCDQAMIHKRLSAYSHQHPTDQKNNFNLVWTDWDALNCSGVVDSLDTVCALTQIKWQLSVWLLSESQELCMWMIRTLFCVSILGH